MKADNKFNKKKYYKEWDDENMRLSRAVQLAEFDSLYLIAYTYNCMKFLTWILLLIFSVLQVFIVKWTVTKITWGITATLILILMVIKWRNESGKKEI